MMVLAASHAYAADGANLKTLLEKGLKKGYPGIAVLTQTASGKVQSAAVGYSNLEKRIPMQVDDAFHMASINKTFTAASILRLVDRGKLSLDATLKDCLGKAVERIPNADRITVAQMLVHSSGIYPTNNDMDYLTTIIGPNADPHRVWTPQELVALADKDRRKPVAEPGIGHFYSDTNYILLGMIVEKISGKLYKQFVQESLLEPLQMRSTYFYSSFIKENGNLPARTVQGYLLSTEELRKAITINPMFKPVPGDQRKEGQLLNTTLAAERTDPAAGLVTTLPDLLKFASALFRGKLLKPASQRWLMAVTAEMDQQPINKKRVWALQSAHKSFGVIVYKEGDGPGGVNTLMAYDPATDRIFLGFTNIFGYFDEVDFMMDDVMGPLVEADQRQAK